MMNDIVASSLFEDHFDNLAKRDAKRKSTALILGTGDATVAAEAVGLGAELGVPDHAVLAAPNMFRSRADILRATTILEQNPQLGNWLGNPINGALAKDDLSNLSQMARIGAAARQGQASAVVRGNEMGRDLSAGLEGGIVGEAFADLGQVFDDALLTNSDGSPNAFGRLANSTRAQAMEQDGIPRRLIGGESVSQQERVDAILASDLGPIYEAAQQTLAEMESAGFAPTSYQDVDGIGSATAFVAENLAASLPQMGATIASGGMGPIVSTVLLGGEANQELAESTDLPLNRRVELAFGAGVLMSSFEYVGLGAIFKGVGAGTVAREALEGTLVQRLVNNGVAQTTANMIQAAVVEGSTEALQEAVVMGAVAAGGGEVSAEEVQERLFAAFVTGGAVGAGMRGGVEGPTRVTRNLSEQLQRFMNSGQAASTIDEVDQLAAESKVRERSPDKFLEALQASGADQASLYVSAEGLQEYYQAKDLILDEETLRAWGIEPREFDEMQAAGGDIAVPVANYAANISGTEDAAWFRDNAILTPDEMSVADAQAFNEQVREIVDEEMEKAEAERLADMESRASDVQVYDQMFSQLRAAGRSPDVAQQEATVWSAFWRSMSDRYGEDALELARSMGVEVRGAQTPEVARRRDRLDIMLNTLRAQGEKALAPRGDGILQFVAAQGGVRDTGGDVEALNPPSGTIGETRAEIAEREAQPNLGGGIDFNARGRGLDELGRAMIEAGYFPEYMGGANTNADGTVVDEAAIALEAISEAVAGRERYLEGEGPDADLADLASLLSERGIDIAQSNDDIAAALEVEPDGQVYNQEGELITETEAFKEWFGDSKVVDQNGDPLVVYHGTAFAHEGFNPALSPVIWGSSGTSIPAEYASERAPDGRGEVMPLYMAVKRPFNADLGLSKSVTSAEFANAAIEQSSKSENDAEVERAFLDFMDAVDNKGSRGKEFAREAFWFRTHEVFFEHQKAAGLDLLKSLGFDGIMMIEGGEQTFGAFAPSQVKSTNNRGTFDANDPRILYQSLPEFSQETKDKALSDYRMSRGVKIGAKAKIWRGVSDESGGGMATYGQGLYTTASKSYAKQYAGGAGRVVEMDRDDLPQNALRFDTINDYEIWFQQAEKAAGFSGRRDRQAAGYVEPEQFIQAIDPDVDGLQIGTGRDAFFVKWDGRRVYKQEKRGSIQLPRGGLTEGQTVINLFESADLSTFLHESGHFFLEAFTELATREESPQAMRDDLAVIHKYLGVEGGAALTREQHETWARGFEAYLMEGNAPSLELGSAFARFKSWLGRIYGVVKNLRVRLNPDIREVMDRMIATDREIEAARADLGMRPLFTDAGVVGMSDADFATYQRMARRSAEQAEANLLKRTMAKITRETKAWYKEERDAVQAEVEARINKMPVYRLTEMATNQKWLGDTDQEIPDIRIDRAQLVEQFGEGVIAELSKSRLGGRRAIYAKDGESPDMVAHIFGFSNAGDMVSALQNAGKRKDVIAQEVDRIMVERHGDPLNDGSIEEAAAAAVHSEQQAATVTAEARALAKRLGQPTRDIKAKFYRQRARQVFGRMSVKEASRPVRFLQAERKAARVAERAFAKVARGGKDVEQSLSLAMQAKERQALNHYLYHEAMEFERKLQRGREKMRSYSKQSVRDKLEGGYIEQIDALLERFDFRVRSNKQITRAENLRAYMDRMIEEGREGELSIDDRLVDESRRQHYTRMSVDELQGLFDTVANIDHMGRFKQKLIDAQKKRDYEEVISGVLGSINKNNKDRKPGRTRQKGEQGRKDRRDYLNLVLNADTLLRELDGFEDMGPVWSAIKRDVDDGMARLTERRLEMAKQYDAIYNRYSAAELRDMGVKRHNETLGDSFSKWDIIAIALNTGNETNYKRLTNPRTEGGFTSEQVDAALRELDARDWETVQMIIDQVNSYWPEIEAKEKRLTGVAPPKVEAKVMTEVAPASFRGGYYPIQYDARLSGVQDDLNMKDLAESLMGGKFGKAQTKNGHTKARVATVNRPLELDLSVAHAHTSQVLYDLEIGEAVTNAWRLLHDKRVKSAFKNKGKTPDFEALEIWLQDTASGDQTAARGMEKYVRHIRSGFVISRLALNISTAAIQPTGLVQSAVVIGKKEMAQGTVEYMRHPKRWVEDVMSVSPFMRERQTTFERDIFNVVGDLEGGPVSGRWAKFQRDVILPASFLLMQKVQFYAVDMPTWVGAYNKELKLSGDEAKARSYADSMVKRAQGSGLMSDRGMLERGTTSKDSRQREFPKILTALGSYMFAKGNVAYETTVKTNFRNPVEAISWAVDMALLFTLEAVLYSAVKGFLPEDDENDAVWLAKETMFSMMSTLPILREVSGGMQGFGSGGVLGSTLDKVAIKPFQQAAQGEVDKAAVKALIDMGGILLHLPSSQTNAVINAVFEDDMGIKREIPYGRAVGIGAGDQSLVEWWMNNR